MANEVATIETRATQLAEKIEVLVTEARQKVASVANTAQVYTYYEIGRYIVEDEQGGKVRAEYGKGVLKRVSERLTERLGKGWSEENLRLMRKFYTLYSHGQSPINKIQTNGLEIQSPKIQTTGSEIKSENSNHRLRNHQFVLPWSHYQILTHVKDSDALVELTLPKDANIYAQQYALCLPDKALLQQKLREWIEEYRKEDEG
jgi:hypothetical protein